MRILPFAIVPMWLLGSPSLFAQVPAVPESVQVLTDLGALGFLAWYCWYVTSRAIPNLAKTMQEESREARADAKAEREKHDGTVDKFVEELAQQRESQTAAIAGLAEQCKSVHEGKGH